MTSGSILTPSRASTVTVCSGKGGVGKSTIALLVASRLAESGKRTILIDADFGIGDLATMTNLTPLVGFEQMLSGDARLADAILRVGPRLSIIGTLPGAEFEITAVTEQGIANCGDIDDEYEVIVFDTPSTLEVFNLNLIGASDLAVIVTTSRIPSIADSYVQLKRIANLGSRTTNCFLVNQVESEAEGDQTSSKFAELVERFLGQRIPAVGTVEADRRIEKAAESQALLELTRQPGGFGKKADKMIKTLLEKHINQPRRSCSIWEQLSTTIFLRNDVSFDDTKLLVPVQG
jgi:flagellar biosynthesis protein FlhG